MTTVSISLPSKLRAETDSLVKKGYFSSFSDAVRSALRNMLESSKYDIWAEEAKEDLAKGEALVLKDSTDIEKLFE